MADLTHRSGVTGIVPEHWASLMQVPLRKSLVAAETANTQFEPILKDGDTIHQSYYDNLTVTDYTPGTDISGHEQLTAHDESLTVNQSKIVRTYVDDVEELQSRPDIQETLTNEAAYQLRDNIDTNTLLNVTGAASSLDEGDIGGTSGSAITATSGNVIDVFSSAREKLRRMNVEEMGDWIVVAKPSLIQKIEEKAANTGFNVADSTLKNGFVGNWMGFNWFMSNNLPSTSYGGTSNTDNVYIGRSRQISLVSQMAPKVYIKDAEKRLGQYIYMHALYGTNLFTKPSNRFLNAKIYVS